MSSAAAAAEAPPPAPRFDTIFVLDTSFSMTTTDPDNTSAEVIHMLMDMSEAERTRIGYVAYNHSIVAAQPLTDISIKDKRNRLKSDLESLRRRGSTDVGLGLLKGTNMLAEQQQEGSRAYVVLLSDGATDIGSNSKRTNRDSDRDVSAAIALAKKKQFPIYTIGLNHDGTVNEKELGRIAAETGGKSYMTSSAEDLPELFNQIYADQAQSILVPVAALTASGALQEIPVTVPNGSMSEANVILISEHPITETQLFYQSTNVRMYNSNKYTILKIASPEKGKFNMKFRGSSGDLVKIYILSNYEFHGQATLIPPKDAKAEAVKGQPAHFEAELLLPDGTPLKDSDVYKSAKAILTVTNDDDGKSAQTEMAYLDGKLQTDYTFPASASYSWSVRVEGSDFYRLLSGGKLKLGNIPPEKGSASDSVSLRKEDKTAAIKLDTLFNDPNNDPLTYEILPDSEGKAVKASLTEDALALSLVKTGSATIKIRAIDPEGGSVTREFTVNVHSSWTPVIRIGLIVLGVIIIGIALFYFLKPKPAFAGRLEGYFLNTASGNEIPVTYWPLTSFSNSNVTLLQLFRALQINEPLPEAAQISFQAGKNETLYVKNSSRATLIRGKTMLRKDRAELMQYGDKLYITFEDGVTELELRYKPIKPSTNIFTRPE
ncbi:vWA domain-containing protein [Paenibacillus gorillae]|uniref:vWA domain-containing protein n=1 Tax=Paenibacillus gorillae TaxID=1243662 RepID=UPI000693AEF8|nr:vWA domain-containing protein [Paenibacillus gorillae]